MSPYSRMTRLLRKQIFLACSFLACFFLFASFNYESNSITCYNTTGCLAKYTLELHGANSSTYGVDCKKIFDNDTEELRRVKTLDVMNGDRAATNSRARLQNFDLPLNTSCSLVTDLFLNKKLTLSESSEEREFPIAFSILFYNDLYQFLYLFQTLYRTTNYYCLHLDAKAPVKWYRFVKLLAKCLPNVIEPGEERLSVDWGYYSVLEAEILCMRLLYYTYTDWKYYINLTGQEFPLKTNLELVKILKMLKQTNQLSVENKDMFLSRFPRKKFPYKFDWLKGSVHIIVIRSFVHFVLHDEKALDVRESLRFCAIPDESYFSTLNYNPVFKAPGGYIGPVITHPVLFPFIVRYKVWRIMSEPCQGKHVRGICIWSIADLPDMIHRPELFTNKFHWNYQHAALTCLREAITERAVSKKVSVNLTQYTMLPTVRHRVA